MTPGMENQMAKDMETGFYKGLYAALGLTSLITEHLLWAIWISRIIVWG